MRGTIKRTLHGTIALSLFVVLACQPGESEPGSEANGDESPAAMSEQAAEPRIQDPDTRRVHERMMTAMGGQEAWERARYFEFDWIVMRGGEEAVRRTHHWDRYTGEYKVSGDRDGEEVVAVFDTDAPEEGRVWIGGEEVTGARADSLLERAYGWHINDSYWLIMPYKWTDPGVTLTYEGMKEEGGREWEVVHLAFENVGLTPQNQYRALIDPETGLMERWHHYRTEGADPLITEWEAWQQFGPIMLATDKPTPDGSSGIFFENVTVSTEVPDGAFRPPTT